jgi:hypothetical protein
MSLSSALPPILPPKKTATSPAIKAASAGIPELDAINLSIHLNTLKDNGFDFLDVPVQVAIAKKAKNPQEVIQFGNVMKASIIANPLPAINHLFSDPQLQKKPTTTQQLSYWFNGAVGGLPIVEKNVKKIQQDMIQKGNAPVGLEATGAWSPEWQSSLADAISASYDKPQLGNVDAKSTISSLINQGFLSTGLNSVIAIIKIMPRQLVQLAGDLIANIPTAISGDISAPTGNLNAFQKAGKAVAEMPLSPGGEALQTPDKDFEKLTIDRQIEDIGTMLTFVPLGKLAFGTKTVLKKTAAKGAFTIVPLAEVAPKYTILKSIQASAETGAESVFPKIIPRILANTPAMAWMYRGITPALAKSAPLQMTLRDGFAQRLRLPIVQAVNAVSQKVIVAGAVGTGIARGEGKIDENAQDSPLNTALNNLHPISGRLALAFDLFSMQANPGGITKASAAEWAADMKNGGVAIREALDETGALIAWQKANPDMNLEKMIEKHGASTMYQHIIDQINQMSAMHGADLIFNKLKEGGANSPWAMMDDIAKMEKQQEVSHDIWTASEVGKGSALHQARESILLNQNELETGFRAVRARFGSDVREGKIEAGVDNFFEARKVLGKLLEPEAQSYIIHPGTYKAFKDAQNAAEVPEWASAATKAAAEPMPKLNSQWVKSAGIDAKRGGLGLMNKGNIDQPTAMKAVNEFQKALDEAGTIEKENQVKIDIAKYLVENFGIDTRSIGYMSANKMLDVLEGRARKLSVPIFPTVDAPPMIREMFGKLDKLGYKPVAGTDIGHYFTKDLMEGVDLGKLERNQTAQIAAKMGVSPRLTDSHALSARASIEMQIKMQEAIDKGIELPPGYNAPRVLSWLRKGLDENRKLYISQRAALGTATALEKLKMGGYRYEMDQLIATGKAKNEQEAMGLIKNAKKSEQGIRDASKKELLAALMRPMDAISAELMGVEQGTPFMNREAANEIIKAIWTARLNVPSEMVGGLGKIEDIFYAGFGIAGKEIPGMSGRTIPNLTGNALNIRNRVRFQSSLLFAWRRVFKTSAKGITEGVPPTWYPGQKMREMKIEEKANKIYEQNFPKDLNKNLFMDDVERLTNQADLFNVYNPTDFYKWTAYWIHEQGFRGAELVRRTERVMSYAERTAAERSLNAVFYPFSFNKTVMRQFGTYMLTRPAQRIILGGMIAAYDNLDGPTKLKWTEDNLPLIKELEKLNALKHGIGLGGFGGINMPYTQFTTDAFINLFGPKSINYTGDSTIESNTMNLLNAYVPLVKSMQDLLTEGTDSAKTTANFAIKNYGYYIKGTAKGTDTKPIPETLMPVKAQQNQGWDYRSRLITGLKDVLDYNYKHPKNPITWAALQNGDGETLPVEIGILDKSVNKSSIGQLVHYRYPAWDNTAVFSISAKKKTEADRFIGEVTAINPSLGATYRQLEDYANRVNDLVSKDDIPTDNLVTITNEFRKAAIELALRDDSFYKFYKTHYERTFGPLEAFNK